jgi:hypothetical protein
MDIVGLFAKELRFGLSVHLASLILRWIYEGAGL